MKAPSLRVLALASLPALGACADTGTSAPTGPTGPAVEIAVAPLTLPGIDFACYDILVENGVGGALSVPGGTNDVVQLGDPTKTFPTDTATICSSVYGNATGGDISYIAPCDASSDSDLGVDGIQNSVTLWVDGLYTGTAAAPTAFTEWQNPCGTVGCQLDFDCNENEDTLVEFNFTIMRDANQGFFDVAVNFEDIFCSAKFDSCYNMVSGSVQESVLADWSGTPTTVYTFATAGKQYYVAWNATTSTWVLGSLTIDGKFAPGAGTITGAAGPLAPESLLLNGTQTLLPFATTGMTGGTPMNLLFDSLGNRSHTAVGALACTAGPDSTGTELLMTTPTVTCAGPTGPVTFLLDLADKPGGKGTVASAPAGFTLGYALYFGDEDLSCNGALCQKIYYNIALDIGGLDAAGLTNCGFTYAATAQAIGAGVVDANGVFTDANGVYPGIRFGPSIALTNGASESLCTANPLNGSVSDVMTTYVTGSAFGGAQAVTIDFKSVGGIAKGIGQPYSDE